MSQTNAPGDADSQGRPDPADTRVQLLRLLDQGASLACAGELVQAIARVSSAISLLADTGLCDSDLVTAFENQVLLDDPEKRLPTFYLDAGNLLSRQKLPLAAMAAYSIAINCAPDSAAAYSARGTLLTDMKGFDQALVDHAKAVAISPDHLPFHFAMIETLKAKGDFGQAEKSCRLVLQIDPSSAQAWQCLGRLLQTTGNFEDAASSFRQSLKIQPDGITALLLAKMPRQTQPADEQRIVDLLKNPQLPPRDRVAAGFALGDFLDEAGRYDQAFSAYATANASFKQLSAVAGHFFDGHDLHRTVDELIETIMPDYFRSRSDFGQPSDLPVFIVGMPRSGTSLVEQIAASHSKVFGAGELTEIPLIRARLAETVQPDSPRHWHRHWHRHLAKVHLARLGILGGNAERVTDKLPVNILNLGLIATMFPGARVILCERDPRDTCLSCYFQLFEHHNLMFSYDLADCATQHREQDRLAAHWKRVLPLRMLSVQYEELVANLETQSRRLIDFLGLEWEPACLDFHKTDRPVLTKSVWQVRQPLYLRSVGRWKQYEKHLGALRAIKGS